MTKKEFKTNYPYLATVDPYYMEHRNDDFGYKTERGKLNFLARKEAAEKAVFEHSEPKEISINIEWKRSSVWGNNPHLEASICYKDGTFEFFKTTCSGCGYDKCSQVVSEVFDKAARSILWRKRRQIKKAPYGIRQTSLTFEGGIGINCYLYGIADFLDMKAEENRRAKNYDYFCFTAKK